MKKQNILARVGIFALAATTLCTTALAAEVPKSEAPDKDPYLYYRDGVQVAKDVYPNRDAVNNTGTVDEAVATCDFTYFIVDQDGVRQVSESEYISTVSEPTSRSTGSWYIKDSKLTSGQTKYYYQGNGDDFSVDEDEYLHLTIDVEDHDRYFGVGYTGTSEFLSYITITEDHGAKIAFIDAIVVPGTYRIVIENAGPDTEIINGDIDVWKR